MASGKVHTDGVPCASSCVFLHISPSEKSSQLSSPLITPFLELLRTDPFKLLAFNIGETEVIQLFNPFVNFSVFYMLNTKKVDKISLIRISIKIRLTGSSAFRLPKVARV